jgi:hypothetical protein
MHEEDNAGLSRTYVATDIEIVTVPKHSKHYNINHSKNKNCINYNNHSYDVNQEFQSF